MAVFAISLAFLILMWLLANNKANETSTLFFLVPPFQLYCFFIIEETLLFLIFGFFSCLGVFWLKFQINLKILSIVFIFKHC